MPSFEQIKIMVNRVVYRNKYRTKNRNFNLWIFGEWFGSKCNDSCLALANYVAEEYPNIKICWIANEKCQGIELLNKRIIILRKDSNEAFNTLKKAGVVFVNEGLQDLSEAGYNYSSGALIINLWHGVPWKKIGMDSYKRNQVYTRLYAKTIFKLQEFSFFPSPSDPCTDTLLSGFMLKPKNIIKTGLPRNTIFYSKDKLRDIKANIVKRIPSTINIDEKTKIISYLPTFRDSKHNSFNFAYFENQERLLKVLEDHNAVIVQKSHIANQRRNDGFDKTSAERIITWNDCSAQELMAASDMLITDYSSCFFDFLILDRPIIHYIYDYDYYSGSDRGLYYKKEDVVCGDVVMNEKELLDSIVANLEQPEKDAGLRELRKKQFLTYESSDSCKVITEYILNKIKEMKG